jgi:hypothetical protein
VFKLFKKTSIPPNAGLRRSWTTHGVLVGPTDTGTHLTAPLLPAFIAQLQDDGYAIEVSDGVLITWDSLFEALQSPGYVDLPQILSLPPVTRARPILKSANALTDENFSIAFAGWQQDDGTVHDFDTVGALLRQDNTVELMQPAQWQLLTEVIRFARRTADQRDDLTHRQAWGRIRKLSLISNARLDDFLYRSVVLTPEKLEIGIRKSVHVADDNVIEIEPGFAGAPGDWLSRFDNSQEVLDR